MSAQKLQKFNPGRSLISSLSLMLLVSGASATDSYNGAELTVPSMTIGSATYNNLVVTAGSIVSGPTGTAPASNRDIYNPANNQLSIPAVVFGGSTYYNVVITVGNLVSIGSVTGADNYNGYDLSIPVVEVLGGMSYTNVAVTVGGNISVAGGMPAATADTYNPGTNRITMAAVEYGGKVYTNVAASIGKVVLAGPASAAQGVYSGISADGYYVLGFVQSSGGYWFLYTTVSLPNPMFSLPPVVGMDSGQGTYLDGGFSAAADVGEDMYEKLIPGSPNTGTQVGTFSSAYSHGQSLEGTVAYVPTGTGGTTFNLAYLAASLAAPVPLAQLAGNYQGVFTSTSVQYSQIDSMDYGPPTATLTITADGAISGPVANSCECAPGSVIGSISPRSDINAYDISLSFVAPAAHANYFFLEPGPYKGIAYYDAGTSTLTLAGIALDNSAVGLVTSGPL